jgi:hypothetical protein
LRAKGPFRVEAAHVPDDPAEPCAERLLLAFVHAVDDRSADLGDECGEPAAERLARGARGEPRAPPVVRILVHADEVPPRERRDDARRRGLVAAEPLGEFAEGPRPPLLDRDEEPELLWRQPELADAAADGQLDRAARGGDEEADRLVRRGGARPVRGRRRRGRFTAAPGDRPSSLP